MSFSRSAAALVAETSALASLAAAWATVPASLAAEEPFRSRDRRASRAIPRACCAALSACAEASTACSAAAFMLAIAAVLSSELSASSEALIAAFAASATSEAASAASLAAFLASPSTSALLAMERAASWALVAVSRTAAASERSCLSPPSFLVLSPSPSPPAASASPPSPPSFPSSLLDSDSLASPLSSSPPFCWFSSSISGMSAPAGVLTCTPSTVVTLSSFTDWTAPDSSTAVCFSDGDIFQYKGWPAGLEARAPP
mmetsp:Transcript_45550/g.144939  ORF Transcript_45550/g.144939 Transcript_45550/m.144939 type:complete len:259 (+) Transcript_45550:685-1461(+)